MKRKNSFIYDLKHNIDRGMILVALLLVCGIFVDICATGFLSIAKGEELRQYAEKNQLYDTSYSSLRGTVYDRNMNILANSIALWNVYINSKGAYPDPNNENPKPETVAKFERMRQEIAAGLSQMLGITPESVYEAMASGKAHVVVAANIDRELMEKVDYYRRESFRDYDANGNLIDKKLREKHLGYINVIGVEMSVKRFYSTSTVASNVLGFTGTDDQGLAGLEAKYDDVLRGVDGRIVSAADGKQNQLAGAYSTVYEGQEGLNLVLTMDDTVQYALDNSLREAMTAYKAEAAYGIVMEVKTGAILGMVSLPDYDSNDPFAVDDAEVLVQYEQQRDEALAEDASDLKKQQYNALTEDEKMYNARVAARNNRWRNRAITDFYDPGSVAKSITVASALEEGVVNENTTFTCVGSIQVADTPYRCHVYPNSHGKEALVDLLKNSCNPFAITVAKTLGAKEYYKYFEAFGFTEQTGVDLPGEGKPKAGVTYHTFSNFGITELASSSFGQGFAVTALQMLTAISAIANGGKLMQPYIVAKQLDGEGNVVSVTQPTQRRQVISEQTSKRMNAMLERVVGDKDGGGKNAYVAGYRVCGKTGTSNLQQKDDQYVASFVGYAPADDPQISIIVVVYKPDPDGNHGGGNVAAPIAGQVLGEILPNMNIEASFNESEVDYMTKACPDVAGQNASEAAKQLRGEGYTVKIRGDGETVLNQTPYAGSQITNGGVIILYTEYNYEDTTVEVPDFRGSSIDEVRETASEIGLNIRVSGNTNDRASRAYYQSVEAGMLVTAGSSITVSFRSDRGVGDLYGDSN
ncbi:MAG: PASTA domain-containing protein [Clostridia bacterium]|nr:PASTA domain-containing protein [Clostridia bacterium]